MLNTQQSSEQRLTELLRARIPIISLVTCEENRAMQSLHKIGAGLPYPRPVYVWSCTNGLVGPKDEKIASTQMPDDVLQAILKMSTAGLFILKDFYHYLQDPGVCRFLRDAVDTLPTLSGKAGKAIILLGVSSELPQDLLKDVTVVDFELPGEPELLQVLEHIGQARAVNNRPPIKSLQEPANKQIVVEACLGLTRTEAENAIAVSIAHEDDINATHIMREKKGIVRRSGMLEFHEPDVNMSDIGGLVDLKTFFKKRKNSFSAAARKYGLPAPKGILMLGIPGTGKSLAAKAIAAEWNRPLLRLDMSKIYGSLVGQSETNMTNALKVAEAVAPCILWVDELEKSMSGVQSSGATDSGVTARVFGSFLTWLSEKTSPVFVACTANDVRSLPAELLRKGRLDEIFFVDLPSCKARQEIFEIHLRKRGRKPKDFDCEGLAEITEGFSGSEIEQAVIGGLYEAFDEGREVTSGDILTTVTSTMPLSKTMEEQITFIRQWSDGRARRADPVEAVSVERSRFLDD